MSDTFRCGYKQARKEILGLLRREIDVLVEAGRDSSRSPTDRLMQRCFCEMFEMLEKKIEAMEGN
jgi:hypothetical protein